MEESRRRITRNAPVLREETSYVDKLINVTEGEHKLFLFWESAPVLKVSRLNEGKYE